MQTSMFSAWIAKYFTPVINKFTELFNGKKAESPYMYEQMLDEEYSADLTWSSTELNNSVVAADVVSMDSSLPLKKRGTIRTATGDIPKIGIKKQMKEKAISDVYVMQSKGQTAAQIASKILSNVPKVISGIKIRLEIMFEQALSNGYYLMSSEDNDGTGVRASFGYRDDHTFKAGPAAWSDVTNATPLADLHKMFDKASEDGDVITDVFLSKMYFDFARKAKDIKELVATSLKQIILDTANIPVPSKQTTIAALEEEFNATFHIVNNTYKIEDASGEQHSIRPWEQGHVVGVTSTKVGRLVYGTLAEDMNRVNGVNYEKSGFILVSQYSHNEPSLAEFTAAQALAMPVIDDGGSVYLLQADASDAFDVSTDSLTFKAAADTTGQKVIVHSDSGNYTVASNQTWCTVTKRAETVTVKVAANESKVQRTATITVTEGDNSATIAVTQEA